jgi:hypothetical protein
MEGNNHSAKFTKDLLAAGPPIAHDETGHREPLDPKLVAQFVNLELSEPAGEYVGWLIGRYRDWYDAFLLEMTKRNARPSADKSGEATRA